MENEEQASILERKTEAYTAAKSRSHKQTCCLVLWAAISITSSICLLPSVTRSSLRLPHFHMHLRNTDNATWISYLDEVLQVMSHYATELKGYSLNSFDPGYDFVSNNAYTFDYTTWCRQNPSTVSISCYKGTGMDVVSGLVTDLGAQIGVAGRIDNPSAFADKIANTFRSTLKELDGFYLAAKTNPAGGSLDMQKLLFVHKIILSMILGKAILIVKLVQTSLFIFTSFMFLTTNYLCPYWKRAWNKAISIVLLALCEIGTFVIYTIEIIYLRKLNLVSRRHGIVFTVGLGSTFLVIELFLGIVVGVLYLVD